MDKPAIEQVRELMGPGAHFEYQGDSIVWAVGSDGIPWGCGQSETLALKDAAANYVVKP